MSVLTVDNIHKSFGSLKVLKGISFSMEKGETIAIIGSSGGGKSTLLRCLTFLDTFDVGSMEIDDNVVIKKAKDYTPISNRDARKVKRLVSKYGNEASIYPSDSQLKPEALKMELVFQNFNLFPHLNVMDNLIIAPILVKKTLKQDAVLQALEILEKVGLSEKANNYPCQLSGGQQQRVAIARALMMKPAILCFDEPTSALDPELTGEVLRAISELKADKTTMIIVTHEIQFAKEIADRIIFIDKGVILENGTPDQVFNNSNNQRTQDFLNGLSRGMN